MRSDFHFFCLLCAGTRALSRNPLSFVCNVLFNAESNDMSANASARRPSFGVAQDRLPEAAREMKTTSNCANYLRQKGRGSLS
jgi:hypothetical protein